MTSTSMKDQESVVYQPNTVFVKNINYDCSEAEFTEYCSKLVGYVTSRLIVRKYPNESQSTNKGYGFVSFDNETNMNNYLNSEQVFKGRQLFLSRSEQKTEYLAYIRAVNPNTSEEAFKQKFTDATNVSLRMNRYNQPYCLLTFPSQESRSMAMGTKHTVDGTEYSVFIYRKPRPTKYYQNYYNRSSNNRPYY